MRQVAFIMGMPISLDIPRLTDQQLFGDVFGRLREIDQRFSTFKKDSELSRYRRGELSKEKLSSEMKLVMKACQQAQKNTNGYFSAHFLGTFDPTGYVKGWAISQAEQLLMKSGIKTFCISAGGDVLARSSGKKIWRIGLQNPQNKKTLIAKVSGKNIAVATSGSYERGSHIIDPKTGKPATKLLSISVVGPDITWADVLATAGFAMGKRATNFIDTKSNYEALAVGYDRTIYMSRGMSRLLA